MVRVSTIRLLLTGALIWSALGVQPRSEQQQSAQQQQPAQPVFRTEANYVRVDVFPTKDGQPIADLTADDFEVLEDRVPQKIDAFEHVVIRGNPPQDTRREPNTVAESRAMAAESRARLFVVFLDINHVEVEASHRIRQPLIDALNKMIGPDDLVGVMTPEMAASDITFARKTTTIEGFLTKYWTWGERDRLTSPDPIYDQYRACYPGIGPNPQCPDDDRGVADEMIERHREKETIDALTDLVGYLHGVREERKAILAVSDGWRLLGPDPSLMRELYCQVPTAPTAGVDPRNGRLTTKDTSASNRPSVCEGDRMTLANMDDRQQFKNILDEANRANASFYPIDPRGLAVFDTSLADHRTGNAPAGSTNITPPSVDSAMLAARLDSLKTLAEATDGLAIVNSNDLTGGMKRVVDDLSSYYLLGYYSSGKLDGRFHAISVRVKRPGVQVRARRGYLAATPAAISSAPSGTGGAGAAEAAAAAHAIDTALVPLAGYVRDVPLHLMAVAGWKPDQATAVWLVAEPARPADWMSGGDLTALLVDRSGETVASAHSQIEANARSVKVPLTVPMPLSVGDYTIQLRIKPAGPAAATTDTARMTMAAAPRPTGAIFLRRGPTTGNRDLPTADLRFRRGDRVTVEIPAAAATGEPAARLLDRTGKALSAVPITAASRVDPDGMRWLTAQVALAPLASGDYLIEITSGSEVMLSPFRVIP